MLENVDLIESSERLRMQRMKQSVIEECNLGRIISGNISNVLGKVNEIVKPWDIYPELFAEEKRLYDQEKQQDDAVRIRETRRAYAQEFNARRQRRGEA